MTPNYTLEDEHEFIEEDERAEVIKNLTDDEEIDAAIELIKEKYDAPQEETVSAESEPESPSAGGEDTSETARDITQIDEGDNSVKEIETEESAKSEEEFRLTEEIINQQPEEYRAILIKYKDKPREELEKAIVNAVLFKNDKDLIKALISVQRDVGRQEQQKPVEQDTRSKTELPPLPEDETIKSILQQETINRLKKIYPDMPEDMNTEEYREWERELLEEGGLIKANKYLKDLETINNEVKSELQKVIYAKNNLKNLYIESPTELIPLLDDNMIPKLKEVNDNYKEINNRTLEEEVNAIKNELNKFGLTEKDLGIDLSLTKDNAGVYYNEYLNTLMLNGGEIDSNVISRIGKIPLLKKGQLAKKFVYENMPNILTKIVNRKVTKNEQETERLKKENLNIPSSSKFKYTMPEDISKITDDNTLDKIIESLKNKYS